MSETVFGTVKRLPSEAEQVSKVAARWRSAYCSKGLSGEYWGHVHGGNSAYIYARLAAMPDGSTASDVAAIIGNDSWIGETCTFCHVRAIEGFQVGEEPDCESATVILCASCAETVAEELSARGPR